MKLDIKKCKEYLRSDKYDFKTFSMGYTKSEKKRIQRFDLKEEKKDFNHLGSILDMKGLNEFLLNIGTNTQDDIKMMEKLIMNIIRTVLKVYKKKHFWLSIRIDKPNHDYDIPRWHKDGPFFKDNLFFKFDSNELYTSKFVTILKGPGTLLIKGTNKVNQIHIENLKKECGEALPPKNQKMADEQNLRIQEKYRYGLAKKLADEKIVQVKNTQGLIFFTGVTMEHGALHSEPPINEPRMFISILPSSETNIITLKKKWNI
jgi:hypothetical protein